MRPALINVGGITFLMDQDTRELVGVQRSDSSIRLFSLTEAVAPAEPGPQPFVDLELSFGAAAVLTYDPEATYPSDSLQFEVQTLAALVAVYANAVTFQNVNQGAIVPISAGNLQIQLAQDIGPASSPSFVTVTATGQLIGKGTGTDDLPPAGYIGEIIRDTSNTPGVSAANPVSLAASVTPYVIRHIVLNPGDYDLHGMHVIITDGATTIGTILCGVSGTMGLPPAQWSGSQVRAQAALAVPFNPQTVAPVRDLKVHTGLTQDVYLIAWAQLGGALPCWGDLWARRKR